MRRLIYIPVVHTQTDMGSLLPAVKREFVEKYRATDWHKLGEAVQEFWRGLQQRVVELQLDYQETYIYQDGLPACGKEAQIVTDLARQGSANHQLVLWLVDRGAHLVGTESPKLLVEEYQLIRQVFSAAEGKEREAAVAAYKERAAELLAQRDDYMRRRIDATLPDGCVGVLFIGLTHRVDEGRASDIQVSYLIHNLPFKRSGDIDRL